MLKPSTASSRFLQLARTAGAVLIGLLLALASLWLYTRNNRFPLNYQPDEKSKAFQISGSLQRRNFNHPLLMVESANLVRKWFDVPIYEARELVIAGRATSAGLAAIGILALALAGYTAYGYRGLSITGAIMALCPSTLVYAHFFKEDATLAAGIAVTIFGAAWVVNTQKLWQQLIGCLVLGAGCAAAASGKYVGVMVVPASVVTVILGGRAPAKLLSAGVPAGVEGPNLEVSERQLRRKFLGVLLRLLIFSTATIAAAMTINARAFESFWPPKLLPTAVDHIRFSFAHGTTGHYGISLPKPNTYCLKESFYQLMPHLRVSASLGLIYLLAKRKLSRWGIVLAAFFVTIAITLACDAIPFPRYALPLTLILYFISAQLLTTALDVLSKRRWLSNLALSVFLAAIILIQGERCLNYNRQFADDSRQRIRQWIPAHLPADCLILAEQYTGLEEPDNLRFPERELGVKVEGRDFVADFGDSIDQLAAEGADYIAVSSEASARLFVPGVQPTPDEPYYLAHHQKFYTDLYTRGQLVWSSIPSPPIHGDVNPELRIYRISQLRPPGYSRTSSPLLHQQWQQRLRGRY